jgi:NADH dehydrogenase (ubiquinone) Fe-S protein 1
LPDSKKKIENAEFIWLLGADKITVPEIPENAFVVYQGHHGDEGAY